MIDEYQEMVAALFKRVDFSHDLLHAALGLGSEAGEVQTTVKRMHAYDADLDTNNLLEELGDIMFYAVALAQVCGMSMEQVLEANMRKLSRRYPSGTYSNDQALRRADKDGGE
jgi:NTP pyrophosphatase (non-canonical NTP hydrolase)